MNSKTKGSSKEKNSEELVIYLNKEKKPRLPGPTLPTASYYNCSQRKTFCSDMLVQPPLPSSCLECEGERAAILTTRAPVCE